MKALRMTVAVLALALVLLPASALAQADPAAVEQMLFDALNRGDVAGVLATFTDDAVFDGPGLCAQAPCVGKAAIQKEMEREVAGHTRITVVSRQVSGSAVTGRLEVRGDGLRQAGFDRIVGTNTSEVRGDKLASVRFRIDPGDAETGRFLTFQRVVSVVAAFETALNAGNAEGVVALFADDAVITSSTTTVSGKSRIRTFVSGLVAQTFRVESVANRRVEGDKETHTALVSTDAWKRAAIAPLEATAAVVVRGDKITSFTVTYTPESLAKLRAAATPAPTQLPRTGGPAALLLLAPVAAAAMLAAGHALRR
jgi:uncharacterized protein (TIGR02246 family)